MRRLILALALPLALAACPATDKTAITACSGYAVALSSAADLRAAGKLSAAEIAGVDQARGILTPICTQAKPPALDFATAASAETAAAQLIAIVKGH